MAAESRGGMTSTLKKKGKAKKSKIPPRDTLTEQQVSSCVCLCSSAESRMEPALFAAPDDFRSSVCRRRKSKRPLTFWTPMAQVDLQCDSQRSASCSCVVPFQACTTEHH